MRKCIIHLNKRVEVEADQVQILIIRIIKRLHLFRHILPEKHQHKFNKGLIHLSIKCA